MSRTTNTRGFALGAVFAMVASLFGAVPASSAPSTTAFTFAPASGSSYTVFADHDFHMVVQRDASIVTAADFETLLKYDITDTRGFGPSASSYSLRVLAGTFSGVVTSLPGNANYIVSSSAGVEADTWNTQRIHYQGNAYSDVTSIPAYVAGGKAPTGSYVVTPASKSASVTNFIGLQLGFAGAGEYANSNSPSVTVTVRAFLDLNNDNIFQAASEPSGTQTVTFASHGSIANSVSVDAFEEGATTAIGRASIDASVLNLNQTSGKWGMRFTQWTKYGAATGVSYSATAESTVAFAEGAGLLFTQSVTILAASKSHSVSAQLMFFRDSTTFEDAAASLALGLKNDQEKYNIAASQSQVILWHTRGGVIATTDAATSFTSYAVADSNVLGGTFAATSYDVRYNQTYTIRLSASGVISESNPVATFTFSNPTLSSTKYYSVNGGSNVTSGTHSAVTATVNRVTGLASITVTTVGFASPDALSISAVINGHAEREIALYPVTLTYTLTADATELAIAPGGTANVGVTVKDQFGVKSSELNQRIKFSWASGYGGSATVSDVALSSGYATAAMVHSAATSTASASITAQLQNYSAGAWSNDSAAAVTVNVTPTNATNAFRAGLAASYSASISYGAAFSWSAEINDAYVVVTGSAVAVSGTGLIFKDALGNTASDSITLPGDANAQAKFYVTARKAGSYTLTLTAGSATTTSLIVVNPARSDAGASITWDTTTITPGKTKVVTGTLVDANGNPVNTTGPGEGADDSGTASIVVTYTGTAGIVVGTTPTETDANGNFAVSVLTSTADEGTLTVTAVYNPQGSATATANKVTSVNAITIGATATEADASKKVTVGSFKGYVAIYTLGYDGQKLSAKVAGKWLVVDPIVAMTGKSYSRTVRDTGAGYTIKVDLYIDGVFLRSETIVTK
jgi:hypothetical protein